MKVKSTEARDFLVTRRAKITPEQAGLSYYGGDRRWKEHQPWTLVPSAPLVSRSPRSGWDA